jgi:beta-glucosidase-like glycosyl hydrolase
MYKRSKIVIAACLISSVISVSWTWSLRSKTKHTSENVRQILTSMSLEEKIGQLFMIASFTDAALNPDFAQKIINPDPAYAEKLIREYHVGGVLFVGKGTRASQYSMVERFQACTKTPLLMALTAEWGSAMRLTDGFCCEKNEQLAKRTDQEIYDIAVCIGKELKELGLHINFAPVADINTNEDNLIIGVRSFGNSPELVSKKASAYAAGLRDAGILACAKHFPGHGDTATDPHFALPQLPHSKERLQSVEFQPFIHLIQSGVPMVMVGHLGVQEYDQTGASASLSRTLVHDLLRTELGFKGLIITDVLGMGALATYGTPGELACAALHAGNDMLLCSLDVPQAIARIKEVLLDGCLSMHELDEHVLRILRVKQQMQLI